MTDVEKITARALLHTLVRHTKRQLEAQQAIGLTGVAPASAKAQAWWQARHQKLQALSMERRKHMIHANGLSLKEPTFASKPPAPQPAKEVPRKIAQDRSHTPSPAANLFDATHTQDAQKPKEAPSKTQGALWRQLGSRPTSLFSKKAAVATSKPRETRMESHKPEEERIATSSQPASSPKIQSRYTVPQMTSKNASTPTLFDAPEEENPTTSTLRGFDATHDERLIISEMTPDEKLVFLRSCLGACARCKLSTQRHKIVFGDGSPWARIVFVGEGPGYHEDRQGIPFVGKAGQLLNRMIEAMGLKRDDIYICNVVKCRPPNNRDPQVDEIAACSPYLYKQLETINPQVIITLGRFASQTLLESPQPMRMLRGNWQKWRNVAVMPTFHPAYLLRNPEKKRDTWSDLQKVMARLNLERPSSVS